MREQATSRTKSSVRVVAFSTESLRGVFRVRLLPKRCVVMLLEALEAWWLAEDFIPDETQLREKLKSLIETGA